MSELKSNLRRIGVISNTKGKKVIFRDQFTKAIVKNKQIETEDDDNVKCLKGFSEGAKCKTLKPNKEAVI